MTDLRFHHVGLACRQIDREREAHVALGFQPEGEVFVDPRQKIRGQFLVQGGFRVELLEPAGNDSPLVPYLRRGEKMYHQAFETASLDQSIARLTAGGALLVVPPVPAVAFDGRAVAFLMLKTMLLVELIESPRGRS